MAGERAVLTSPAVRALARQYGVSLYAVQGTGRDGRVLKEDVLRCVCVPGGALQRWNENRTGVGQAMLSKRFSARVMIRCGWH